MLFEIHDIILHRLWKQAFSIRKRAMKHILSPVMLKVPYPVWLAVKATYSVTGWWNRLTKRWYMNHVRKAKHLNAANQDLWFVDARRKGDDLKDVFINKKILKQSAIFHHPV